MQGPIKLIKLRYGRKVLSVNCIKEITGNLVVAGAVKVGKTTFLKSLQKLIDPNNMRKIYGIESTKKVGPQQLPRTLLLGKTVISGMGEKEVSMDDVSVFSTTDRFNYLGVISYLTKLDSPKNDNNYYSKITLRVFDSPGYAEEPILGCLEEIGINKNHVDDWRNTTFRITNMLEFVVKSFPTILIVLLSPGGPIADIPNKNKGFLLDPTDSHGFHTLQEIITEMGNANYKTPLGFTPFLGNIPIFVAFTKTDQNGPKKHYETEKARAKTWKGVHSIMDLSSIPYVGVSEAWQKIEQLLWLSAKKLN